MWEGERLHCLSSIGDVSPSPVIFSYTYNYSTHVATGRSGLWSLWRYNMCYSNQPGRPYFHPHACTQESLCQSIFVTWATMSA